MTALVYRMVNCMENRVSKSFPVLLALGLGLAAASASNAATLTGEQLASICGKRLNCTLASTLEAGTAEDGIPRLVAEIRLALGDRPKDAPEEGCRHDGDNDGGSEFWVFNGRKPPVVLLELCNDGYGAAGVGEDEVAVEDNRLTHTQYGGSSWRWSNAITYRLEPLTRLETTDCFFHTGTAGSGLLSYADHWNARLRSFAFDSRGEESAEEIGCPDKPLPGASPRPSAGVLSALTLPGFGPGHDVRNLRKIPTGVALADCALAVSTDAANGFLVYGQPARKDAAEMRVAVDTASSLVVQIFDPLAKANQFAGNWVHQPHVELWRLPKPEDRYTYPKTAEQIGIDLAGKPWPGINAGKLPDVERWTAKDERGREVIVLRVTWPGEDALAWGIGAVYSQAEQGRQSRLIATTGIERNKPLFLPQARRLDRDCSLQNGLWRLQPPGEIQASK